MFGEKPIVGQTILRINKDRIILPSFTHVEAGDEVSATFDVYQKKIILLQEKELIERLNTLLKEINPDSYELDKLDAYVVTLGEVKDKA
jgi:hypothetical protein